MTIGVLGEEIVPVACQSQRRDVYVVASYATYRSPFYENGNNNTTFGGGGASATLFPHQIYDPL